MDIDRGGERDWWVVLNSVIVTHPDNKAELQRAFGEDMPGSFWGYSPFLRINGLPVEYNEHIPRRKIREQWHAPQDRFIEYGPEDEQSCRYFGLGRVEEIDEGPLFYEVSKPLFFGGYNFTVKEPRFLISNSV